MKSRLAFLVLFASLLIAVSPVSAISQGIKSPIANLALEGNWEEHADWVGEPAADTESVFYQAESGALLRLGRREAWSDEKATEVATLFQKVVAANSPHNPQNVPHLQFQRNIGRTYFPLPDNYMEQNSDRITSGRKPLRVWELRGIQGNVRAFYASQLSPGLLVAEADRQLTVYPEWSPATLLRAERRQIDNGEAILAELETDQPVEKKVAEKFKMPPGVGGQRVRYIYVNYAPEGFRGSGTAIVVVVAAPTNANFTADAILHTMVSSVTKAK